MIAFDEVLEAAARVPPPDRTVAYGPHPAQFAALWRPVGVGAGVGAGEGVGDSAIARVRARVPVIIFLHGGCWLSDYGVGHAAPVAQALRDLGVAVWTPEYRRVGDAGGGDPGTFDDVSQSIHTLADLADEEGLDLSNVALMGHSAGGHLALWVAGEPVFEVRGMALRGVVSLAGIASLTEYRSPEGCGASVDLLLGGSPNEVPGAFQVRDPIQRPPLGPRVPVILVEAKEDEIVPPQQAQAYRTHDPTASHRLMPGGHFDPIAPWSPAWPGVVAALRGLRP